MQFNPFFYYICRDSETDLNLQHTQKDPFEIIFQHFIQVYDRYFNYFSEVHTFTG